MVPTPLSFSLFFFNDTATTEIYTLSLHDALPICAEILRLWVTSEDYTQDIRVSLEILDRLADAYRRIRNTFRMRRYARSEEHTSELQSRLHLVCRLLLEKKKQSGQRDLVVSGSPS